MQHPKALLWSIVVIVIVIAILYYLSVTGWQNPFSGFSATSTPSEIGNVTSLDGLNDSAKQQVINTYTVPSSPGSTPEPTTEQKNQYAVPSKQSPPKQTQDPGVEDLYSVPK